MRVGACVRETCGFPESVSSSDILTTAQIAAAALRSGRSIANTYSEPVVFYEYADIATWPNKLAARAFGRFS